MKLVFRLCFFIGWALLIGFGLNQADNLKTTNWFLAVLFALFTLHLHLVHLKSKKQ